MTTPTDPDENTSAAPRPRAADRVRTIAVGGSAATMILVPLLGPLIAGTEEGAEEFDTEITPPDYAFIIWAPIFATAAVNAIQHTVNLTATINQRTGWWLAGCYSTNTAWSLAAQSNHFRYTSYILPIAAGFAGLAHRHAQNDQPRGAEHLVAQSSGMLFGWTSVASIVNIFATLRRGKLAPTTRTGRTTAGLAVAGATIALSAIIATSRHGQTAIALASGWALTTNAANPERTTRIRQINASGATLIAGTTVIKLWRSGRKRPHQAT